MLFWVTDHFTAYFAVGFLRSCRSYDRASDLNDNCEFLCALFPSNMQYVQSLAGDNLALVFLLVKVTEARFDLIGCMRAHLRVWIEFVPHVGRLQEVLRQADG